MTQTPTSTTQSAREMAALADRVEQHVKLLQRFDTDMNMKTWNILSNDLLDAAKALRTVAAATVSWDREAVARVIDPQAFIIPNSKRFEVKERQNAALAKADAILATPAAGYEAGEMREALELARKRIVYLAGFAGVRHETANEREFLPSIDAALAALPVQGTQSSEGGVEASRHAASSNVPVGVTSGSGGVAPAPSEAIPTREVEVLRKLAFGLTPAEQFRLAFLVAENVGYVLEREPDHPACPHATVRVPLVLGGDDIQTRCEQPEFSGHDGSEAKSGWRDISTAPKDESDFLAWGRLHGQRIAYFANWLDNLDGQYKTGFRDTYNLDRLPDLTHWKPLDASPTDGDAA